MTKPATGQLLLERGAVTRETLDRAEKAARAGGGRICSQLLAMGACDEQTLVSVLAEKHGVPGVDLSQTVVSTEVLDSVPRAVAENDLILPLSRDGGRLHLAVASTQDSAKVVDEVRFVTGLEVSPYVAVQASLKRAIAGAYAALENGESAWSGADAPGDAPNLAHVMPAGVPADESLEVLESEFELVENEEVVTIDADEPLGAAAAEAAPARGAPPAAKASAAKAPAPAAKAPAAKAPPPPAKAPPAARTPAPAEVEIAVGVDDGEEVVAEARTLPGPKRVLVVDDEAEIRKLVERTLQAKGFTVETAADGEEGLRKVRAGMPDLVLLDAMLPKLHGFEVARRMRSDAATKEVPIVIMTAIYRGWRFAQDARENYGAEDYIEKPFRIDDFLRRVEAVLESTASRRVPVVSADPQLQKGRELLLAGQLEAAIAVFEEAVRTDPFSPEGHYQHAKALRARGEHFRAMTAFERAAELRPGFFPALRSLAALYLEKGFRRKAAETLERALGAAPDAPTRDTIKKDLLKLL